MSTDLERIKNIRKKYGLTQKELADRAEVSQSLIAKIEAGTLDPTYTNAQKIFSALEGLREKKEVKAKEVMHKKVDFAERRDTVREIIKLMKKKGISQLPVLDKGKVCGMISERVILKSVVDNPEKVAHLKVEEVMEDAPPIVSLKTGLTTLLNLMQEYSVILVADKGEIKGIISKSDLLGKI